MAAPAVARFEVTGNDGPAMQRLHSDLSSWQVQDTGDGSGDGWRWTPGHLRYRGFAFFADHPESHIVGLSKGGVQ
jgi:hypothetical protein